MSNLSLYSRDRQAYFRQYHIDNKEQINLKARQHYHDNKDNEDFQNRIRAKTIRNRTKLRVNNPAKYIFQMAKNRARTKRLEFTITVDDIIVPETCPILGIPIFTDCNIKHNPNAPSLDRIDNTKGYVSGNIIVISWKANDIKKHASLDELICFGEWAKRIIPAQEEKKD